MTPENTPTNTGISIEDARRRVKSLRKYYTSLASFVIVNLFLYLLNFVTSGRITWAFWVTFGWGIGMVFYTVQMFLFGGRFWDDWEKKQLQKMTGKSDI
jgi:hypothetical protein